MIRRPPRSTRTYTRFPDTTLFRSPTFLRRSSASASPPDHRADGRPLLHLIGQRRPQSGTKCLKIDDPAQLFQRVAISRKRSEEHTSELQSLMRISYAVFCLKKKKKVHTLLYETTITYIDIIYNSMLPKLQ